MKIGDFNKIIISDNNLFNNTELEFFKILNEDITKPYKKARICNIYGKNGSGKSTISKNIKYRFENILVSFKDFENNKLVKDDNDRIYLYNEEFIDSNVKTSDRGIKTIIMLGEQKELDDKIETLQDVQGELIKEKDRLSEKKSKNDDEKSPCNPKYFKNLIEKTLRENWASRDKDIKNNSRNSTIQYESLLKNIIDNKNENVSIEELLNAYQDVLDVYKKINSNTEKFSIPFVKIDKFSKNINKVRLVLSKKIEKAEFTEREKLILSKIENGEQRFYETVKDEFSKNDINICPYCFQDVTKIKKEIVENINKILNKDVEEHKDELIKLKDIYNPFCKYEENLKILDEKLILEANNLITKINQELSSSIIFNIDEKLNNIYNPITKFSTNIEVMEKLLNEIIEKLEIKRNEFNKAIEEKENNKLKLDKFNIQISWYDIKDNYNAFIIQEKEYQKLLNEIRQNNIDLKVNKDDIRKLQSDKKNVKIANDKINLFLEYIFLAKDKLKIEYDDTQNKYLVKSHNKDIAPKDLSTGERNIIALCYFFTTILENTNEKDEFKESCLIILDDPISSFDIENKIGLYTFFRMMFDKIIKNNVESKIINFTHSLETMLNLEKACSDIKTKYRLFELQNNALIEFKYKKRNDYQKMLEEIYNYAKIDDPNKVNEFDDSIGNIMRKLLESYATFNYNKSIEELTRNENILKKLNNDNQKEYYKNFMYRLVLNSESHTFDSTRNINFYNYISREEKIKTAKSILFLLYLLDKTHLQLYLNNESYIEKIKEWEIQLIPNLK